jgi:hypothetical protein
MRIPDTVLKCVVFVALKYAREGGFKEMGTAFLMSFPLVDEPGYIDTEGAIFAVTAGHVIDDIRKHPSADGKCYLRMNDREHGASYVEIPIDSWLKPSDLRIDIAAALVKIPDNYDHTTIPSRMFADEEFIQQGPVCPGRELFFPGLFVPHKGERANIPIMRTGSIAAMPIERISTKNHGNIRAYLAEARSIGGLSGSPVFVHMREYSFQHFEFLGMVQGHFDEEYRSTTEDGTLSQGDDIAIRTASEAKINMGIALVIPADDITELLNHPEFLAYRKQIAEAELERKRQMLPTDDAQT